MLDKYENIPIVPPTIQIQSTDSIDGWAEMIYKIYHFGVVMPTEYGNLSRDACVMLSWTGNAIQQILDGDLHHLDPYYSKGKKKLIEYRKQFTPSFDWKAQGFDYTYYERLAYYGGLNQLNLLLAGLKITTRRNIAITWKPRSDPQSDHPPCMQYIWLRRLPKKGTEQEVARLFKELLILPQGKSGTDILDSFQDLMSDYIEVHTTFRSHDAFGGNGSNGHGILNMIADLIYGYNLKIAKYVVFDDTGHIYDNDWDAASKVVPMNFHKF